VQISDNKIQLKEIITNELLFTNEDHSEKIDHCCFNGKSNYLITASKDKIIMLSLPTG